MNAVPPGDCARVVVPGIEAPMKIVNHLIEAEVDALALSIWADDGGFIPNEESVTVDVVPDQNTLPDTDNDRIKLTNDLGTLDRAAAEQIYHEWLPKSIRFIKQLRRELDPDACEDIAHDVILKILRCHSQFDEAEKQVAWIYRLIRNACYDYYRSKNGRTQQLPNEFDRADESHCETQELIAQDVWDRVMNEMSDEEKKIIELLCKDRSGREIARELKVSHSKAKRLIRRLRKHFYVSFGLELSGRGWAIRIAG
jgi:RNA polymerase sigma factor (sigma-70 family)